MRRLLATLVGAASLGQVVAAGEHDAPVPVDKAIETLAALESTYEGYRWQFRRTFHKSANPTALNAAELEFGDPLPWYRAGSVSFDLVNRYYRAEYDMVNRWSGGAADYIAKRGGVSFDGTSYRDWERSAHGTELPPLDAAPTIEANGESLPVGPLLGVISDTIKGEDTFTVRSAGWGRAYLPPYWPTYDSIERPFQPLSEILAERRDRGDSIQVQATSEGVWIVQMPHHNVEGFIRLWVDPRQGGVVTKAEWLNGEPPRVWQRAFVRLRAVCDGISIPEEIHHVNTIDGTAYRTKISNLVLNPAFTPEEFQVRFPEGTMVDDFIAGVAYVVGSDPEALPRYPLP